jgi:hypothetical protein
MNIVHSRKKKDKGMFKFFLVSDFAFLCTMFTLIMENFGEQCYLQEKKRCFCFSVLKGVMGSFKRSGNGPLLNM